MSPSPTCLPYLPPGEQRRLRPLGRATSRRRRRRQTTLEQWTGRTTLRVAGRTDACPGAARALPHPPWTNWPPGGPASGVRGGGVSGRTNGNGNKETTGPAEVRRRITNLRGTLPLRCPSSMTHVKDSAKVMNTRRNIVSTAHGVGGRSPLLHGRKPSHHHARTHNRELTVRCDPCAAPSLPAAAPY